MTYSTRTDELGRVTFTAPAATDTYSGCVWLEDEAGNRQQICHGGEFRGSTITATAGGLKGTAQKWLRQRREWMENA